jgi:hypothetical protein
MKPPFFRFRAVEQHYVKTMRVHQTWDYFFAATSSRIPKGCALARY